MNTPCCKQLFAAVALAVGLGAAPALAEIKVAATIKPVHSLVAAVMGDVGEPALLLDGPASPHVTALRPSQARIIEDSDVVFAVGEGLEAFLQRLIETDDNTRIVELAEAPGIELLDYREDHDDHDDHADDHDDHEGDHDDHEGDGHDHEHGDVNPHIWLDPANARAMAERIAEVLGTADPVNADSYRGNAEAVISDLNALESELAARLSPVKDRPFLVFHDAYPYFEARFGLEGLGAIVLNPETPPGARRLQEIRNRIEESGAACVFSEPQFEIGYVTTVLEGTAARTASLDPLGVTIEPGPDAYRRMLTDLTDTLADCLAGR
ncbi:MAG TPA: zinc ABC transporter substrate-binding protein [Aestuariivirgaceae bacterium]|nr:zinc ABC transporter substrate-binding protein [Aestuariivirgaceae bacterium]